MNILSKILLFFLLLLAGGSFYSKSLLGEVFVTVVSGNTTEDWRTTVNGKADEGQRAHLATRGTGNAIVATMTGVAIVKDLPEMSKKLAEKIKEVKNLKIANIAKYMETPDFVKLLDNVWGRYKGKLSRVEWEAKYKTLYKNREIGKLTETKFEELMGADAIHLEIQTGAGKRYVDNVQNGVGKEVKSGKVSQFA